jgi:hypothetical protein
MSTKRKANSLGEFLRVHRLSEDMSQVEFAKFMGGVPSSVCVTLSTAAWLSAHSPFMASS